MNKVDMVDIGIRMAKTFIQGFLGAMVVTLPGSDLKDSAVIKSLLIGSLAAGFCAVMNLAIDLLN